MFELIACFWYTFEERRRGGVRGYFLALTKNIYKPIFDNPYTKVFFFVRAVMNRLFS